MGEDIRPEEIILEIYRQKQQCLEAGIKPVKVVLPIKLHRLIQRYHELLGNIDGPMPDYLQEDSIFGLEICIDNDSKIVVLPEF